MSDLLRVAEGWRTGYLGAVVGLLALRGVANPTRHPELDRAKAELEAALRARYGDLDRAGLRATPPFPAYAAYYRRFGQRYHVALQLESVVFKGKPIPAVAALVEAMFMAELQTGLLTAGHDLDALALPLRLDAACGDERYVVLGGAAVVAKAGDMLLADGQGVVSAVITGPDARTRITPATRAALFAVYAPPEVGVAAVEAHLDAIVANVRLVTPEAETIGRLAAEATGARTTR